MLVLVSIQIVLSTEIPSLDGGQRRLLPPPGGYVIILVCMCVCVCVCVYVCLSVNTITQKIINIWTSNFAHTFAIA